MKPGADPLPALREADLLEGAPTRLQALRSTQGPGRRHSRPRKGGDRSYRNLAALPATASTSRVLNLIEIGRRYGHLPEHSGWPMFRSQTLNQCLIVKHRLRPDEMDLFDDDRQIATKVLLPFSRQDFSLGAQAIFVGARGWTDFVMSVSADISAYNRDRGVLEMLDQLPSLDPFLLREALRLGQFEVAPCYFALSEADAARMFEFVAQQIQRLIRIAINNASFHEARSTQRLVEALLSSEVDERLEPLRQTLALDSNAFQEGVFCWKGFLYYKWSLASITKDVAEVMEEIDRLATVGLRDAEAERAVALAKARIKRAVLQHQRTLAQTIQVYDDAFDDLTQNGQPAAFRDFLLDAPGMFFSLGERIGGIAHINSFWRYRFPGGAPLRTSVQEAVELFADFEESVCLTDSSRPRRLGARN